MKYLEMVQKVCDYSVASVKWVMNVSGQLEKRLQLEAEIVAELERLYEIEKSCSKV